MFSVYDNNGFGILIESSLSKKKFKRVSACLRKYRDMFTTELSQIESADVEPHFLLLDDYTPVRRNNCVLSAAESQALGNVANIYENAGIIKRWRSPYKSSPFLMADDNGEYKLMVNYKHVNGKLINHYANRGLPIEYKLFRMRDAEYYSKISFAHGFLQIPLANDSKDVTGFAVNGIEYVFNRLPEGLSISAGVFNSAILNVLSEMLRDKVIVHSSQVFVYGETFNEALENTDEALYRLDEAGFSLETTKCEFLVNSVYFDKYCLSGTALEMPEEFYNSVKEMEPPTTLREVRRLLGCVQSYAEMVKNHAKLSAPLNDLLKGCSPTFNADVDLGNRELTSFNLLKERMLSAPTLTIFDCDNSDTFMIMNVSEVAVGAELMQTDPTTGDDVLIEYFSKKVPNSKRNYNEVDLEMFGITEACLHFELYLLNGPPFIVYTKNRNLLRIDWSENLSVNPNQFLNKINEYSFSVKHNSERYDNGDRFLRYWDVNELIFENGDVQSVRY